MWVTERLDVSHNFVTIDSPIKFFLEINGDVKTRVLKSSQAIQIDCRKLLTKKDMPSFPAWTLSLIYDDSLLAPGEKVNWYAHDVDFAGSQDSVNGQLVDVDLSALYSELSVNNDALISSVETVGSSVDAVKSSVDAVKSSVDASFESVYYVSGMFQVVFREIFDKTFDELLGGFVVRLRKPMIIDANKRYDNVDHWVEYVLGENTILTISLSVVSVTPILYHEMLAIRGKFWRDGVEVVGTEFYQTDQNISSIYQVHYCL